MSDRLTRVREQLTKRRVDAILLTNLDNIRYASGFSGSSATVVITSKRAVILVDSRYTLQAKEECPGFEVIQYSGDVLKTTNDILLEDKVASVGFEAEYVTISTHRKMRKMIDKGVRLVGTKRVIEDIRLVKDADEIRKLKKAIALADECFDHIISFVKPGMTERDVALEIYLYMYKNGAESLAFDTIVAAGPHAAFPHAEPGQAVLQKGQMLKMDYGARVDGYNSDITRTIFLGEPDDKQKEVYNTVLDAQLKAIEAIKPGVLGKDIDAIARDYIASKGYGENFGHGLGHSLGMATHDGPGLSSGSDIALESGMVMTVEPGIYIEGWGGVRIEDDVLVTETGCEILTKARKDIVVVKG
jgi:Xaa-Pro aminopeptidase